MTHFPIPEAALDADISILGRKGGGKTYTAKGIVERLLTMGRRVLVLDPLGVWAGLRTGSDGKTAGFPIAIFGGAHGDMPLDPAAAVPMADILARQNVPAVIDLADLSKTAQQAFLLAFLRELRRVNTEALTIVLEEADVFAPQNPLGDDSKALHAEIDWIARRGRFRGFRLITITQRPARLSKDVLTQCATLVAHRLPAPQDREAVKAWVDGNGDRDQAKEVFDTLARLEVGEAWVWASEDGTIRRERFPRIKTLDTSATPKAGEKRVEPKTLAQVDLSKIKAAMEAAIHEKPGKVAPERRASEAELAAAERRGYERGLADGRKEVEDRVRGALGTPVAEARQADPMPAPNREPRPRAAPSRTANGHAASGALPPPRQKILDGLAWLATIGNTQPDKTTLAHFVGVSPTSGGYFNNLGALRGAGLVDYPSGGFVALTAEGLKIAVAPAAPPTHEAIMSLVSARISSSMMKVLQAAVDIHPEPIEKDRLACSIGVSPTSGGYFNNLGRLRSMGLVDYPSKGTVRAADLLFPGAH